MRERNVKVAAKKVIAITGPTASGKSALAMSLCEKSGCEIVSCDSMQVYRGMDIGTAKPSAADMARVRHHMIDVADPRENFSCADYVALASKCIEDIFSRGNIPVICGGTGMYFERLVATSPPLSPPCDESVRRSLEQNDSQFNYETLRRVDPETAAKTHMNNRKRVIRALEIYICSGIPKSVWDEKTQKDPPRYELKHVSLISLDRDYLYQRIDSRVDAMIKQGLEGEVRELNLPSDITSMQAIGYKEMKEYTNGEVTFEEAVNNIKRKSRNYAKRQFTWFRRYGDARFFDIDGGRNYENIVNFLYSLVE